ncbi:hypothetical protein ETB97_006861 [Aspergillus alliaceus]|uniref:Uncharacterized protein n=1 Tax=Petromyces alliaceus TaxID=209559 RepID=A0A8H6ECY8_PETAA|nr:hypothetical protein ETB97_006861 [Aspergillus burnettii]
MMTVYTINFQSKRGVNSNYALFIEPPVISGTSPEACMNVWYTSFVLNHGYFDIKTGVDYYAWVGTATAKPAPGVTVNTDTFGMVIEAQYPDDHGPPLPLPRELIRD